MRLRFVSEKGFGRYCATFLRYSFYWGVAGPDLYDPGAAHQMARLVVNAGALAAFEKFS